ncbi:NUDIX hydrolase [Streptomyces otsuchiensis]|uniref:NUDIX hydrolase n=1 Tax=Streptomyces otsuchiensis TaxID=2681388 RepID=UPI0010323158|nr:NUDIX hydrolase [Streptomyces otsuchiensis]
MDVVERWNGHLACALQHALRLSNEAFAEQLGVAPRTVASWHADARIVPRVDVQRLLDNAHEAATDVARRRFAHAIAAGLGPAPPYGAGHGPPARGTPANPGGAPDAGLAHPLRVAIAVVTRGDEVLLVHRRDGDAEGLTWQFPAGVIKPGAKPQNATVRETLEETGVHCTVRRALGSRLHPLNKVGCVYFLCDYLAGEAVNRDTVENLDVAWVPRSSLTRFIPIDLIYPPILAALEDLEDDA